jgi:hypothetical protein
MNALIQFGGDHDFEIDAVEHPAHFHPGIKKPVTKVTGF